MSARTILSNAQCEAQEWLMIAYHERRILGWWWETPTHIGLLLPSRAAMTVELPAIREALGRLTPRESKTKGSAA